MAALIPESAQKIFTPEMLRSAAKQSQRCHIVPVRLRRAISKFVSEEDDPHMRRKVMCLSESLNDIKSVQSHLPAAMVKDLVDDPMKALQTSKRWKVKSVYGDIGFTYQDDHTVAYVAARMPAIYSALYRVLKEVRRRLPDFTPAKVLDFGAGTGSAFWAVREVWPRTVEKVNIVEPSQSMLRAGQRLMQGLKNLPLIHSYESLQELNKKISKSERKHNFVIASYVLGEIPSLKDQITTVRQLWDLTEDMLILVEPGTPQGSKIISQMRAHILWMEKRKLRKVKLNEASKDLVDLKSGCYIVAPCPHDGACPLVNSGKYCHFAQRLERTETQRVYKRAKGSAPLRGFEDEKFSYVVFRRGQRPREPWPLDGVTLPTRKEMLANRNLEDLEPDNGNVDENDNDDGEVTEEETGIVNEDTENDEDDEEIENDEDDEGEDETERANMGSGWGRIVFMPMWRGSHVTLDVCRSTEPDGSKGSFERMTFSRSKHPILHWQAKKSMGGDLWPF